MRFLAALGVAAYVGLAPAGTLAQRVPFSSTGMDMLEGNALSVVDGASALADPSTELQELVKRQDQKKVDGFSDQVLEDIIRKKKLVIHLGRLIQRQQALATAAQNAKDSPALANATFHKLCFTAQLERLSAELRDICEEAVPEEFIVENNPDKFIEQIQALLAQLQQQLLLILQNPAQAPTVNAQITILITQVNVIIGKLELSNEKIRIEIVRVTVLIQRLQVDVTLNEAQKETAIAELQAQLVILRNNERRFLILILQLQSQVQAPNVVPSTQLQSTFISIRQTFLIFLGNGAQGNGVIKPEDLVEAKSPIESFLEFLLKVQGDLNTVNTLISGRIEEANDNQALIDALQGKLTANKGEITVVTALIVEVRNLLTINTVNPTDFNQLIGNVLQNLNNLNPNKPSQLQALQGELGSLSNIRVSVSTTIVLIQALQAPPPDTTPENTATLTFLQGLIPQLQGLLGQIEEGENSAKPIEEQILKFIAAINLARVQLASLLESGETEGLGPAQVQLIQLIQTGSQLLLTLSNLFAENINELQALIALNNAANNAALDDLKDRITQLQDVRRQLLVALLQAGGVLKDDLAKALELMNEINKAVADGSGDVNLVNGATNRVFIMLVAFRELLASLGTTQQFLKIELTVSSNITLINQDITSIQKFIAQINLLLQPLGKLFGLLGVSGQPTSPSVGGGEEEGNGNNGLGVINAEFECLAQISHIIQVLSQTDTISSELEALLIRISAEFAKKKPNLTKLTAFLPLLDAHRLKVDEGLETIGELQTLVQLALAAMRERLKLLKASANSSQAEITAVEAAIAALQAKIPDLNAAEAQLIADKALIDTATIQIGNFDLLKAFDKVHDDANDANEQAFKDKISQLLTFIAAAESNASTLMQMIEEVSKARIDAIKEFIAIKEGSNPSPIGMAIAKARVDELTATLERLHTARDALATVLEQALARIKKLLQHTLEHRELAVSRLTRLMLQGNVDPARLQSALQDFQNELNEFNRIREVGLKAIEILEILRNPVILDQHHEDLKKLKVQAEAKLAALQQALKGAKGGAKTKIRKQIRSLEAIILYLTGETTKAGSAHSLGKTQLAKFTQIKLSFLALVFEDFVAPEIPAPPETTSQTSTSATSLPIITSTVGPLTSTSTSLSILTTFVLPNLTPVLTTTSPISTSSSSLTTLPTTTLEPEPIPNVTSHTDPFPSEVPTENATLSILTTVTLTPVVINPVTQTSTNIDGETTVNPLTTSTIVDPFGTTTPILPYTPSEIVPPLELETTVYPGQVDTTIVDPFGTETPTVQPTLSILTTTILDTTLLPGSTSTIVDPFGTLSPIVPTDPVLPPFAGETTVNPGPTQTTIIDPFGKETPTVTAPSDFVPPTAAIAISAQLQDLNTLIAQMSDAVKDDPSSGQSKILILQVRQKMAELTPALSGLEPIIDELKEVLTAARAAQNAARLELIRNPSSPEAAQKLVEATQEVKAVRSFTEKILKKLERVANKVLPNLRDFIKDNSSRFESESDVLTQLQAINKLAKSSIAGLKEVHIPSVQGALTRDLRKLFRDLRAAKKLIEGSLKGSKGRDRVSLKDQLAKVERESDRVRKALRPPGLGASKGAMSDGSYSEGVTSAESGLEEPLELLDGNVGETTGAGGLVDIEEVGPTGTGGLGGIDGTGSTVAGGIDDNGSNGTDGLGDLYGTGRTGTDSLGGVDGTGSTGAGIIDGTGGLGGLGGIDGTGGLGGIDGTGSTGAGIIDGTGSTGTGGIGGIEGTGSTGTGSRGGIDSTGSTGTGGLGGIDGTGSTGTGGLGGVDGTGLGGVEDTGSSGAGIIGGSRSAGTGIVDDIGNAGLNGGTGTPGFGSGFPSGVDLESAEILNNFTGSLGDNSLTAPFATGDLLENIAHNKVIDLWNQADARTASLRQQVIAEARARAQNPIKTAEEAAQRAKNLAILEVRQSVGSLPFDATCTGGRRCPLGLCCGKNGMCGTGDNFCGATTCASQCEFNSQDTKSKICTKGGLLPKLVRGSQTRLNEMITVQRRLQERHRQTLDALKPRIEELAEEVHFLEMLLRTNIGVTTNGKVDGSGREVLGQGTALSKDELDRIASDIESRILQKVDFVKLHLHDHLNHHHTVHHSQVHPVTNTNEE